MQPRPIRVAPRIVVNGSITVSCADLDVDVDHGRGRVDDRHAGEHVALVDRLLGERAHLARARRGR